MTRAPASLSNRGLLGLPAAHSEIRGYCKEICQDDFTVKKQVPGGTQEFTGRRVVSLKSLRMLASRLPPDVPATQVFAEIPSALQFCSRSAKALVQPRMGIPGKRAGALVTTNSLVQPAGPSGDPEYHRLG